MLAMPLATAGIGFWTTLLMLVGLWAVMSYTALLLVEVYQYNDTDTGLSSLAYKYLGRSGQWLTGLSMPFLMYSLVAAYLVGGGDIIQVFVATVLNLEIPSYFGVLLFADRKSTRLNSSHVRISYAVFCLKKKTTLSLAAGERSAALLLAVRRPALNQTRA